MPAPTPESYKGRKIKAIPYDQNGRPASVLVLPIVGMDGLITGYLPPKVTDNGDGTGTLSVTANVSIGDVTLTASDIEIGAVELKNGTDDTRAKVNASNELQVRDDDAVTALGLLATEATLGTLLTQATFLAEDFATETTLLSVLAAITALDTIVDGETPAGVVDGFNDTFTTFTTFKPGTTHIFVNGLRQREGVGNDYVEQVDNQTLIFEPGNIPPAAATLIVDYRVLP